MAKSLDDIAETFTLSDTIPFRLRPLTKNIHHIRNARSYAELDVGKLASWRTQDAILLSWFSKPNVFVPPGVLAELEKGLVTTHNSFDIFETAAGFGSTRFRYSNSYNPEARALFIEVFDQYCRIVDKVKTKVYHPPTAAYPALLEYIIKLTRIADLKKRNKSTQDKFADEDLIACAIYASVAEQKPSTIATADCDIAKIFRGVVPILTQDHGRARNMRSALKKSKIFVYKTIKPTRDPEHMPNLAHVASTSLALKFKPPSVLRFHPELGRALHISRLLLEARTAMQTAYTAASSSRYPLRPADNAL